MKRLFFAVIIILSVAPICAGEDRTQDDGLFSKGSFLSEAISSAASKIDKVTSGEERIVDDNAKGIDNDTLEYDGNPLSRPRAALNQSNSRHKTSSGGEGEPGRYKE